jgi:hypothetical protein
MLEDGITSHACSAHASVQTVDSFVVRRPDIGKQVSSHLTREYTNFEHKLKDPKLSEEEKPMVYIPKSESLAVAEPPPFMVEMQKQYMEKFSKADFGAALGSLLGM